MTQDEYVEKYRPIFGGLLLEACMSGKTGAEAYVLLRQLWAKQDALLRKGFVELTQPPAKPPQNGAAAVQPKESRAAK